jgi:hypothetical protein
MARGYGIHREAPSRGNCSSESQRIPIALSSITQPADEPDPHSIRHRPLALATERTPKTDTLNGAGTSAPCTALTLLTKNRRQHQTFSTGWRCSLPSNFRNRRRHRKSMSIPVAENLPLFWLEIELLSIRHRGDYCSTPTGAFSCGRLELDANCLWR